MVYLDVVRSRQGKLKVCVEGLLPSSVCSLLRETVGILDVGGRLLFPIDYYSIQTIIESVPDVKLSDNLKTWYQEKTAEEQRFTSIKDVQDVDVGASGSSLLPFQRVGAHFLASRGKAILADQMGLGKSAQAIIATTLPTQARRVLVVCPNSVKLFWQTEIERWNPGHRRRVINGSKRTEAVEEIAQEGGYLIVNYEMLYRLPEISKVAWDWVILDEAHRIKNRKTKTFAAVKALRYERIAMLTGTPFGNDPSELWTLLHLTDPNKWTSFWKFYDAFVHSVDLPFGGRKVIGSKNEDLLKKHLSTVMLRRTRREVNISIPDMHFREIPLKLLPAQAKAYREMAKLMRVELENGEELRAWSAGAKFIRLRQIVSTLACIGDKDVSAKLDALMELIEDEGGDEQWVVFSQFRDTVDAVYQRCQDKGIATIQFKGGDSPAYVSQCIKDFSQKKAQVLVATMGAGGEGHNLQCAHNLVRVDLWFNPNVNEQAAYRLARLGQTQEVTVTDLYCPGTVDDVVKRILARKTRMTDAILREELLAHLEEIGA